MIYVSILSFIFLIIFVSKYMFSHQSFMIEVKQNSTELNNKKQ